MSQSVNRGGRPSRYNATVAEAICWRLADGELMINIAAEPEMPHRGTIYRWAEDNLKFRDMLSRARVLQAHAAAEKGVRIAINATVENARAAEVQFAGYKWFASKVLPQTYGDKMLHTGADGEGPIAVKLALDYSLLTLQEQTQMLALIEKATPRKLEAIAAPEIEGEAEEENEHGD
jgi:hypothetical protein